MKKKKSKILEHHGRPPFWEFERPMVKPDAFLDRRLIAVREALLRKHQKAEFGRRPRKGMTEMTEMTKAVLPSR